MFEFYILSSLIVRLPRSKKKYINCTVELVTWILTYVWQKRENDCFAVRKLENHFQIDLQGVFFFFNFFFDDSIQFRFAKNPRNYIDCTGYGTLFNYTREELKGLNSKCLLFFFYFFLDSKSEQVGTVQGTTARSIPLTPNLLHE